MKINYSVGKAGIVTLLLTALTGCTTYVVQRPEPQPAYVPPPAPQPAPVYVQQAPPPPEPIYVQPAPAVVVIQREDDFYQPLSPYGEWVVVGSYGRVWRPRQVESGWRPYSNGHWELTDDGWYWASDEPWAWATYHYGRWEQAGNYGWIWVPQTEWAPAWVSWRQGGGYVGWAPLPPERRGGVTVNVTIAPTAFCYVEERHMHEPVRPQTVIVNNTTIINKTVNITKTKVVNKVVINEGPRSDEVEHASGRKIEKVSVNELRHKEEAPVADKNRNLQPRPENRLLQPVPKQPESPKEIRAQEPPKPERVNSPDIKNHQDEVIKNAHPPIAPTPRETEKPVRKDGVPVNPPVHVEPQPLPVVPPHEVLPKEDKNNRERQGRDGREQTPPPKPAPTPLQTRPVERPTLGNSNERQLLNQKPEIQAQPQTRQERNANKPDQQKNVSPKEKEKNTPKAKDRGTNAPDDATPRERRNN